MSVYPCVRCGLFWAFNSGPRDNFSVITRFCPDCLAQVLPVIGRVGWAA